MGPARAGWRGLTGAVLAVMMGATGGAGQAPARFCPSFWFDLIESCPTGPAPFWQEAMDRPGCFVWNPYPQADETVSWSGWCPGGKPHGKGMEVWRVHHDALPIPIPVESREAGEWEGERVKITGEGSYVDGNREGRWVWLLPYGWRSEGSYVDGKMSGVWADRNAAGTVWIGPYVDGRKSGVWVERTFLSSSDLPIVSEGRYVDDKKTGLWVTRFPEGFVRECRYIAGRPFGSACRGRDLVD